MTRVLVTGGAGFLGSHLCDRLIERGHQVLCVDNFSTGSRSNIAQLISNPNFKVQQHDICTPLNEDVDEIYNLACPASPCSYQQDPIQTMRTNVIGSLNLLELAKITGAKIVQASTSEVYGDPIIHPQVESYWGNVNPVGVRSCYDEGKRAAETLFADYRRVYGVESKIVRIFNTYGPRMAIDDGRVVSNFIVQALRGNPITIYGSGNQTRSFCYVDDLIDALMLMMATGYEVGGPINLGNPMECTIKELASNIQRLTNNNHDINHFELPFDDPQRRKPDITLARKLLEWEPRVPLESGLIKTIQYFKSIV